mmetsp:Transcript_93827/g.208755  ORF Transcript_93827/g.208755 Transcript_93827/m.208755 type:complete len:104 (-) Transcript_93827:15-326(-)
MAGFFQVKTFPCGDVANGNVYWGHMQTPLAASPIAVHANWMLAATHEQDCLRVAGFWSLVEEARPAGNTTPGIDRRCGESRAVAGAVSATANGFVECSVRASN